MADEPTTELEVTLDEIRSLGAGLSIGVMVGAINPYTQQDLARKILEAWKVFDPDAVARADQLYELMYANRENPELN